MTNMESISQQYRQRAGIEKFEDVIKAEAKADKAQHAADVKAEKAEAKAAAEEAE